MAPTRITADVAADTVADRVVSSAVEPVAVPERLATNRRALTPARLLALQRSAGNAAVANLLARQDGPADAGTESLPGGIPPTPEELEGTRLRPIAPRDLLDEDIGPALAVAERDGDIVRYDAILEELAKRTPPERGIGVGMPLALPRGQGGSALVTPEVALAMIENMVGGKPAFKPELGVGGSSLVRHGGNAVDRRGPSNVVPVQVELLDSTGGKVYQQADLDRLFLEEETRARPEVESQVRDQYRVRTGRDAPAKLSKTLADKVAYQLRKLAERRMWERIGREVAASQAKVGEVVLPAGGKFSAEPGRFKVVAEAAKIRVKGGVKPLLDAVAPHASPVPALEAEAAALAKTLGQAAKVRTVFRVGGRILIVFAVAHDIYRIIVAEDKQEAVFTTVGGWAGASAGAAAFAAIWTPADVAGPWAWAIHGVGTLVAGGIGYWAGSEVTRIVYRLTVISQADIRA